MEKYKSVRFAHRGLHGEGAVENSLTAFSRACDAGFGIELDVRLSSDGELVVFHDATLARVCGRDEKVVDLTADELKKIPLGSTEDCIPTFREVLSLVAGRVPLLVEIKKDVGEGAVAERFLSEIADYDGEYIAESFNPFALRTVRRARPDILLGILSTEYTRNEKCKGKIFYRQLERLRMNFLCRPDFIAYDKEGWRVTALRLIRRLFKVPTLAWTVKSEDEERLARSCGFDSVIFEKYMPNNKQMFTKNENEI
ncbi:MAG: glycerophosphodiester phosphodiesterase [Clostridia bacterium]|nr:glycerophosphodiester phosphodiesterase [Clostridia bacterium]